MGFHTKWPAFTSQTSRCQEYWCYEYFNQAVIFHPTLPLSFVWSEIFFFLLFLALTHFDLSFPDAPLWPQLTLCYPVLPLRFPGRMRVFPLGHRGFHHGRVPSDAHASRRIQSRCLLRLRRRRHPHPHPNRAHHAHADGKTPLHVLLPPAGTHP